MRRTVVEGRGRREAPNGGEESETGPEWWGGVDGYVRGGAEWRGGEVVGETAGAERRGGVVER